MTKTKLSSWFSLFLLLLCVGCTGNQGNVGTIVNRPRPPAENLFPDFETYLTQTAIDSTATADATLTARAATTSRFLTTSSQTRTDASVSIPDLWENIFQGSLDEIRTQEHQLETFGTTFSELIATRSITEATDTLQTITSSSELRLVDTTTVWDLEMIQDTTDSDYIRFYFRNQTTGLLQATYIVKTDADNNPVRGLFAWVNPSLLTDSAAADRRLLAYAFDFTNSAQNLAVIREERYHTDLATYYSFQVHYQCDSSTQTCLGEYNEIINPSPNRHLEEEGVRYSWNETTQDVCIGDMDYSDGTVRTLATYEFTGPDTPTEDDLVVDTCVVTTPHWGEHVYTEADLPQRYEDTTPNGGTALQYYVDGISKTGWDTLTPSLIDTWLDASGF